jgi:hypothetical protein
LGIEREEVDKKSRIRIDGTPINPKTNSSNYGKDWEMDWLCFLQESKFLHVVHILEILQVNGVLGLLVVEINAFTFK